MNRVLRGAPFSEHAHPVAFGAPQGLPEEVRSLMEAAAAEAYERGVQEGIQRGLAEATRRAEALVRPVQAALAAGVDELRRLRASEHREVLELAMTIARAVTADVPPGGQQLVDDVAAALDALDDAPLAITAHPQDCGVLEQGLTGRPGLTVGADARLAPGEVRIRGPWSVAEVGRAVTWSVVAEVLGLAGEGAGGPDGEGPGPQAGGGRESPKDSSG